jgi:hypothetical protein
VSRTGLFLVFLSGVVEGQRCQRGFTFELDGDRGIASDAAVVRAGVLFRYHGTKLDCLLMSVLVRRTGEST